MSGRCTGWVLRHGPKTRAQRLVLLAIADAANSDGEHAYPGMAAICEGSLYGRSHVNAIIRCLIDEGWLEIEETGKGRGHATIYRVPMVCNPEPVNNQLSDTLAEPTEPVSEEESDPANEKVSNPATESVQSEGAAPSYATVTTNPPAPAIADAVEELFPEPAPPPKLAPPTRPRSATTSQTATRPERRPEPRPAWDALVAEKGCAPETKSEKNRLGKVLKEITEALRGEYPDISPLEEAKAIHARANRYKQRYGADRFTETALMNHWAECGPRARLVDAPGPAPG